MKKQTLGETIASLPKLAEVLGVSVDELMQTKETGKPSDKKEEIERIISLMLKAIPLAMGVSIVVLSILEKIELYSGFSMAGIAIFCIALGLLRKQE